MKLQIELQIMKIKLDSEHSMCYTLSKEQND